MEEVFGACPGSGLAGVHLKGALQVSRSPSLGIIWLWEGQSFQLQRGSRCHSVTIQKTKDVVEAAPSVFGAGAGDEVLLTRRC